MGLCGVEPPSQSAPRLQRESPSEDEPQTQKRRKPLGFPGGFHGFLYGFTALAHIDLRVGERALAQADREIHAADRARMPDAAFGRPLA